MANNKILVSTIEYGSVDAGCYRSHMQFWYRCGRALPEWEFSFYAPSRLPIDTARNECAQLALTTDCEWLFFYDSDMILDPNVLIELLKHDKPMVMAHTIIRGYPFESMMFRFKDEKKEQLDKYEATEEEIAQGLAQMDAVGTACTLINVGAFKALQRPWFLTSTAHTEDIYFCMKARQLKEFSCWVDFKTVAGHMLDPYMVTSGNRKLLKEYVEKAYPYLIPNAELMERASRNPLEEGI
jgi:hypothetical protein